MLVSDAVLLPLALWSAIALRLGEWNPSILGFNWLMLIAPLVAIPVFIRIGLYRAVIRYMEDQVVLTVFKGVTVAVLLLIVADAMIDSHGVPRSSYLIYWGIALIYIMGSRLMARAYFRKLTHQHVALVRKPIAIYGAGESGMRLANALHGDQNFNVVAFIDDNPDLDGSELGHVRVFNSSRIAEVIDEFSIDTVLLALPSATHKRRNEIIRDLARFKVSIKTIPSMTDLVNGLAKVDEIREVEIEDLLGRDSAQAVNGLIEKCITGKSVMVTGAGGSIGSELCRQILLYAPRCLILFEKSEFALYQIEHELIAVKEKLNSPTQIVSILGSVTHQRRVEHTLRSFGVETIYHAAAYKHVPLVEKNVIEGVINNVFGTWRVAEAARKLGVETFVLISTDKAVRPTNVMGASKRFAELILQAFALEGGATRFCMVRFGNVLGSSGSVVPLFKRQIMQGGPVTVTHPEITRYFMTIPEAAELVLQAGAMAKGGDVFVLDMGSPVKIADLADKMIKLSGLTLRDLNNPDGDIAIEYTGLRPGEKLYEELLIGDDVYGTEHPLIMRAKERELPWNILKGFIDRIDVACHQYDCDEIRNTLIDVVDGYQPQGDVCDHLWTQAHCERV